jgi:hypothetical protein
MRKVSEQVAAVITYVVLFISMEVISWILNFLTPDSTGLQIAKEMSIWVALLLAAVIVFGASIFVVWPALKKKSDYLQVMVWGMLFGLTGFGSEAITGGCNDASIGVRIISLIFSMLITGIGCVIATHVVRQFKVVK